MSFFIVLPFFFVRKVNRCFFICFYALVYHMNPGFYNNKFARLAKIIRFIKRLL